jgi:Ser/Thr protein kinase RdoA (MazF antagonist)
MTLRSQVEKEYSFTISKWIRVRVRDVYQITTRDKKTLCLKGYDMPEPEVLFLTRILRCLRKTDYDFSPKIINTSEHRRWIQWHGKFYMVTNWILGRTSDFANRSELHKAFSTLAKFHQHAEGLSVPAAPGNRVRYDQVTGRPSEYRKVLQGLEGMSAYIELCDQAEHDLQKNIALEAIRREEQKGAFVHGDYNYPNIVKDTRGTLHLIDFENASMMPRVTDLCHILHRNFAWQGGDTLRFIDVYDRVRPLGKADRYLLHALLQLPFPLIRAIRQYPSRFRKEFRFPSSSQISRYRDEINQLV